MAAQLAHWRAHGRFRNPDEDLPADFAARRAACYARLNLPTEPRAFADALRAEMAEALSRLDRSLPRNPGVRIDPRRRHPALVGPLAPQPEPPSLETVKAELGRRWPMTDLLDVFKEADLWIGFTAAFATAAAREATNRGKVRRRLLLCLYSLGTNAGLERLAVGRHGFGYEELLHTAGAGSTPTACAARPGALWTRRWRRGIRASGARARRPTRPTANTSART